MSYSHTRTMCFQTPTCRETCRRCTTHWSCQIREPGRSSLDQSMQRTFFQLRLKPKLHLSRRSHYFVLSCSATKNGRVRFRLQVRLLEIKKNVKVKKGLKMSDFIVIHSLTLLKWSGRKKVSKEEVLWRFSSSRQFVPIEYTLLCINSFLKH